MISSMFIRQHGGGGGSGSGSGSDGSSGNGNSNGNGNDTKLGASISFGVHEAQLEALERKNEDLAEQNRKYALAVETAEAKGRALMAEVKNMRERWQSPAATAAREENEKRYKDLEMKHRTTVSELEACKAEIGRLVEERTPMGTRTRSLESSSTASQQRVENNTEDTEKCLLRADNEKLLARVKSYETGNASQTKTISVLKTVVKTNEQSNVELQKKNLDLVAEINNLESQYESTHKKNIILETKYGRLEDEKAALEIRLRNLIGSDNGNMVLEESIAELTNSNQRLEAKVKQLVDTRAILEEKKSYLEENNKHLADTNIKLHDAKKVAESKAQKFHDEKIHLEGSLRKADKLTSTLSAQRSDLESSNKKFAEENSYLARKNERQSQKIQALENEITTLQERSNRMMSEIHTLRDDKNRLDQHLNDLIRQQRNKRRLSVDNRDRPEFAPHVKNDVQSSSSASLNGHKAHESPASPVMSSRGAKRSADDRDDSSHSATANGGRSNYTIRAIADNPPATPQQPLPSPVHNPQNTNNPSSPSPQTRSLFDRVKPPPLESRSLFDRIAIPSPPSRPQLDREVDDLIASSAAEKRGVFCRFHGYQPKIAELLSLICGGPLESVRMALEKDVAFLWFLRPKDAAAFMNHARSNLNGGKVTLPHPRAGEAPISLEFIWNEKPVRALEKDIASHIVRYGASRAFMIHCVPYEVSLQKIASDVGGKRFGFWLSEGETGKVGKDGRTQGREVVVEFTNVRDAVDARKRLGGDWWAEASWVREGCDRPVPNAG